MPNSKVKRVRHFVNKRKPFLNSPEVENVTNSVVDPDPHGSTLILVGWIRIGIRIGKTDPDSEKYTFFLYFQTFLIFLERSLRVNVHVTGAC
jgi:hypothetical protein